MKLQLYLKGLLVILFSAIIMSGCITQKRCNSKFPPITIEKEIIKHDSIFSQIIVRDTIIDTIIGHDTIYMAGDTVEIFKGLANSKPVTIKGEYADATAQVINSKLIVKLEERAKVLNIKLQGALKELTLYKTYYEISKQKEVITKEVKVGKFYIYYFWITIAMLIGAFLWSKRKLIFKLI